MSDSSPLQFGSLSLEDLRTAAYYCERTPFVGGLSQEITTGKISSDSSPLQFGSLPLEDLSSAADHCKRTITISLGGLSRETTTDKISPLEPRPLSPRFMSDSPPLSPPLSLEDTLRVAADHRERTLFVGCLSQETTEDKLFEVFSAYGEVDEAMVITDENSKSEGYGYVTFKHADGAILGLKDPCKKIDGHDTVTKRADDHGQAVVDESMRKIHVSDIPFEISHDRLLSIFSLYGKIEKGPIGFDKQSGKDKGSAFFVYETEQDARDCLFEPIKTIDGHKVICTLAPDDKKKPDVEVPDVGAVHGMVHPWRKRKHKNRKPNVRPVVSGMHTGSVRPNSGPKGMYRGYPRAGYKGQRMMHPNSGPGGPSGYRSGGPGEPVNWRGPSSNMQMQSSVIRPDSAFQPSHSQAPRPRFPTYQGMPNPY